MTTPDQISEIVYNGNGSTTEFDFTVGANDVYCETSSEIIVAIIDTEDDSVTVKTISTHYTLSGLPSAPVVTFLTAPASTEKVWIYRDNTMVQDVALGLGVVLRTSVIVGLVDRLTRIVQDVRTRVDRAMKRDPRSSGSVWDGEGLRLTNLSPGTASTDAATYGQVAGISYEGEWNSGTAYATSNIVLHNGTVYIALEESTNKEPGVAGDWETYWSALVDSVTWIAGASAPTTEGENGDMYLRTTTGDVYGPKSGGSWGSITANIKGPAGSGSGDMLAATYDPAAKEDQVLTESDFLDEDNMASNSATKVASQQSIKAYVDAAVVALIGDAATGYDTLGELEDQIQAVEAQLTIGKHAIFIPADYMVSRTTSGAEAATTETSTNKVMVSTKNFDASSDEFVQFAFQAPKSWNESTITFQVVWSHPSTATNFGVSFFLQGLSRSNDDALDTAFGTAVEVEDTGGTTNDVYVSPESSAVTIGGTPAEGDYLIFQLYRDVSDSNDTLAVDARVHGVIVYMTFDAGTDD